MRNARFILAAIIVAGAALAACSGNFGSGTTPPGGLLPSGSLAGVNPTPTPTPNSANGIVTYGDSSTFQTLPNAAGYGGAIAFPVPSPKPSGFSPVPVGVTVTTVAPTDAPDLNLTKPGKHPGKRERPARALVYITLLATRDISLDSYPRLAIDVPRDVVTVYREDEIQVALFNSGDKTAKTYTFAVAEHDTTATPPPTPSPAPSAPPKPTPIGASPGASGSPGASASPGVSAPPTAPPSGASPVPSGSSTPSGPTPSPTLPPQRILFAGTAASLKLTANKPVIFAVYALPVETPSPSASGAAAAAARSSAAAKNASASPSASAAPASLSPSSAASGAAAAPASIVPSAASSTGAASPSATAT